MRKLLLCSLASAALGVVSPATAAPVLFDFTTLGAENTLLASSVTVNGVQAEGFQTNLSTTAPLWLRNIPNDHGLGVCSEGAASCGSSGGDVNELDNAGVGEFIRLTLPVGKIWTSLFVSSLDSGGSGGSEEGRLVWSNDASFGAPIGGDNFAFGDFGGSVEGNVLPVIAGFVPTARYLLFTHPAGAGDNNDYLVWKGTYDDDPDFIPAPEPASLALFGLGLMGLGLARRRRG